MIGRPDAFTRDHMMIDHKTRLCHGDTVSTNLYAWASCVNVEFEVGDLVRFKEGRPQAGKAGQVSEVIPVQHREVYDGCYRISIADGGRDEIGFGIDLEPVSVLRLLAEEA